MSLERTAAKAAGTLRRVTQGSPVDRVLHGMKYLSEVCRSVQTSALDGGLACDEAGPFVTMKHKKEQHIEL